MIEIENSKMSYKDKDGFIAGEYGSLWNFGIINSNIGYIILFKPPN